MINASDQKIKLVGRGDLGLPGCCFSCGNGNFDYGYVDLGIWHDEVGNLYLCGTCTQQVTGVYGCLTQEESEYITAVGNQLAAENIKLKQELTRANERLSLFDDALRNLVVNDDGDVRRVSTSISTTSSGTDEGEPVTEESVKVFNPSGTSKSKSSNSSRASRTKNAGNNDAPSL